MPDSIDGFYLDLEFAQPEGRPFVAINMVASLDGKITVEGSERGLGSAADKRLFYELRALSDAVLDGARTVRISGSSPRVREPDLIEWRTARGLPPDPLGVLITASANIPTDIPFFTSPDFRAVAFVSADAPSDRVDRLRQAGRPLHLVTPGEQGVADMVRILHDEYAVRRLLCEGGANLNAQFIRLGLVDEFFLTIAPKIVGGWEGLTAVTGDAYDRETMPALDLVSWRHHEPTGEVFTRWRLRRE